ncbi:MAG: aromatic ring-hydroxylating dioxygenase subunit alpha [Alicyclobacillus sp.]|nr:aromatic ring-hydroxylating dioxygenase subunit alpha [Alicyclobacillus sp.]
MLRHAWYAVCPSADIGRQPQPVQVHGESLVVFRTETGQLCALTAYCPHRGCHLALGSVRGEHLECPFHGWQFDTKGRCVSIPANPPGTRIPERARLRAYPVCERAGLVWVYTGRCQSTPPPLRLFAELEHPLFHRVPFAVRWQVHFTRCVESVLDVAHLPFVHADSMGEGVCPVVTGLLYGQDGHKLWLYPAPFATHPLLPPRLPVATTLQGRTPYEGGAEIELIFPNHWFIRARVEERALLCTYLTFTPVNRQTTLLQGWVMRNFAHDLEVLDEHHLQHTLRVLAQDQRLLESLQPQEVPWDGKREVHMAADAPALRYRHLLQQALLAEADEGLDG